MGSIAWDEAQIAFEALADCAHAPQCTTEQRLQHLEHIQTLERILPALRHQLISELTHAGEDELGGALRHVLADRLRIYRRDAARMIEEAADLGRGAHWPVSRCRRGWRRPWPGRPPGASAPSR